MKIKNRIKWSLLAILFVAQINAQELKFERFIDHSFTEPTELVASGIEGDDRVFIVERGGTVHVVEGASTEDPQLLSDPFISLGNVSTFFEGGLLGMAFDPDYVNNGHFYLSYTANISGDFTSVISRFTVSDPMDNTAMNTTEETVLTLQQPFGNHNGGDIAFGADGMLYIPFGDGGSGGDPFNNSQDPLTWLGKILRIDVSSLPYTIPDDNPFADNDLFLDEIWSVGWRNPYRFSFDRLTGDMWVGDVGQNAVEEIDFEAVDNPGGGNYGWNCKEGSQEFEPGNCASLDDLIDPFFEYLQPLGLSVTGGFVYRGSMYDDLYGKYVFTDYVFSERWWILDGNNSEVQSFTGSERLGNVAALGEDNRGELYALELGVGEVHRIQTNFVSNTKDVQDLKISAFPNPALDEIKIDGLNEDSYSFRIVDVSGKVVLTGQQSEMRIDIRNLSSGFYQLKILQNNKWHRVTFVK